MSSLRSKPLTGKFKYALDYPQLVGQEKVRLGLKDGLEHL